MTTTHFLTCPLCEATCGLAVEVDPAGRAAAVQGDPDDVFSAGYACPKGLLIGDLHHDPDRLTGPLVDGRPASWEQAWRGVPDRLGAGTRGSGGARPAGRGDRAARPGPAGRLPGQSERAQPGRLALRRGAAAGDRQPKRVH